MNRLLSLLFALTLISLPVTGWAQRVDQLPGVSNAPTDERIAAVVNDNVISTSDIDARMKLAMLSAGLPDSPEIRQKLLPQILRGLIDEQLQLQEAKRLDISVPKDEIEQTITKIGHDNNIPGDIRTYITDHGGSADALVQQVKAGLSWGKVVQRELRPHIEVGDDEIDAVIKRIRADAGKEEYLVSEILLAVDNPKEEEQVKQFGENLVQQLKAGANFGAVARQFSQGTGAAAGGDIGWIQEGQLPPELSHTLTDMKQGDIAGPIRSTSGFHILGLREKRVISLGNGKDVRVNLQQVFRPFSADIDKDALLQEADKLRASLKSCSSLQNLSATFPGWHWNTMGDVELDKAPSFIADKVRDLSVGQGSEPLATDKGALIVFVCDRHVPDDNINREAITNTIGTDKLELQARRLLRDLRRGAYLDIRMGAAPS